MTGKTDSPGANYGNSFDAIGIEHYAAGRPLWPASGVAQLWPDAQPNLSPLRAYPAGDDLRHMR
jgi:hypothetical protein